jgi:menaquinone-dependent protoporphyrinogen oxidase
VAVLVAVASKYGATEEIAEGIAGALVQAGLDTKVARVAEVGEGDLAGYEAVVLGSAVYAGRWLEPARTFAEERGGELASRPTWLFSSGPIGDPPRPAPEESVDVEAIVTATGAREHRVFAGKLDRSRLSFGEKALVVAFRAKEGDFRDWDEIAAWGAEIARSLRAHS